MRRLSPSNHGCNLRHLRIARRRVEARLSGLCGACLPNLISSSPGMASPLEGYSAGIGGCGYSILPCNLMQRGDALRHDDCAPMAAATHGICRHGGMGKKCGEVLAGGSGARNGSMFRGLSHTPTTRMPGPPLTSFGVAMISGFAATPLALFEIGVTVVTPVTPFPALRTPPRRVLWHNGSRVEQAPDFDVAALPVGADTQTQARLTFDSGQSLHGHPP
jgi:hypothetical protein